MENLKLFDFDKLTLGKKKKSNAHFFIYSLQDKYYLLIIKLFRIKILEMLTAIYNFSYPKYYTCYAAHTVNKEKNDILVLLSLLLFYSNEYLVWHLLF